MNNRLWIIGAVAAIIAVLGLGWVLAISPKLAEASLADAELAAIEQQNLEQELLLVELRELYQDLDSIEDDIDELRAEIPDSPEVDEFVDAAQAAATTAGVTLKRVSASEPTIYGSAAPVDVVPTEEPQPTPPSVLEGVFTVPVSVDVVGSPESIIRFSELMQTGTRLFVVQQFSLAENPQEATMTGYLFVATSPTGAVPSDAGQ